MELDVTQMHDATSIPSLFIKKGHDIKIVPIYFKNAGYYRPLYLKCNTFQKMANIIIIS